MNQKIRVVFTKTGPLRFISHLDLMRLFQRSSRRAALAVALSQGFSPRPKISIAKALKLGVESSGEEAVFHMARRTDPDVFMVAINAQLPDGVKVVRAEESAV
jgi:radical SAM-linked protein